jgi:histidinol-phosphate aminotransferase
MEQLHLNNGFLCHQEIYNTLIGFTNDEKKKLSIYPDINNSVLKQKIAEIYSINQNEIILNHGSGPILLLSIPNVIKEKIKKSLLLTIKYFLGLETFPILTPIYTYSKIPLYSKKVGIKTKFIPMSSLNEYELDLNFIDNYLSKNNVLVYIPNPNNPTGKYIINKEQVEYFLSKYPNSVFYIDEAYNEYLEDCDNKSCIPLIKKYNNLLISHSFSFAYGMSSLRIGFLVSNEKYISNFSKQLTGYILGNVKEKCAIAALNSRKEHLQYIRNYNNEQWNYFVTEMKDLPIVVYPTQTNYILCYINENIKAKELHDYLSLKSYKIKIIQNYCSNYNFDQYFRITIVHKEQNEQLVKLIKLFFFQHKKEIIKNENINPFISEKININFYNLLTLIITFPWRILNLCFFLMSFGLFCINPSNLSVMAFFLKKAALININLNDFNKCYDNNIIVANHCSVLDEVILSSLFPNYTYLAAKISTKIPIISTILKKTGSIIVDRKKKGKENIQEKINHHIKKKKIIIYPEGVMTNNQSIIKFKKGAFVPGKPVIPVILKYTDFKPSWIRGEDNGLSMLYGIFSKFSINVDVIILPTYIPSIEEKKNPNLFSENVRICMSRNSDLPLSEYQQEDSPAYKYDLS